MIGTVVLVLLGCVVAFFVFCILLAASDKNVRKMYKKFKNNLGFCPVCNENFSGKDFHSYVNPHVANCIVKYSKEHGSKVLR